MKHRLLVTVDDPEGIFEAAGELERDIPELLEPFAMERVKVKVERVERVSHSPFGDLYRARKD